MLVTICPLVCHQTSPCLSTKCPLKTRYKLVLICFQIATEVTKLSENNLVLFIVYEHHTRILGNVHMPVLCALQGFSVQWQCSNGQWWDDG